MQTFIQNLFQPKSKIVAFAQGTIMRLEEIPDTAFSHCLVGDGIALQHCSNEVYAPCSGCISLIAPTKHAFVITTDNGAEVLVHIGLHTSKENEQYFDVHVNVGDYVDETTLCTSIQQAYLEQNKYTVITPIVITNSNQHPIKTRTTANLAKRGKILFTFK